MFTQKIGSSELEASRLVLGVMRMGKLDDKAAAEVLRTALDAGITYFDHADIYCQGDSERVFARVMKANATPRDSVILQSKCGIQQRIGRDVVNIGFNFSYDYILSSVDGILSRLETDYLDVLLLHRPDTLMEPEEVAQVFTELEQAGKVRHFGVSNFNPGQIKLLQTAVKQPIIANQMQFGPAHADMVTAGLNVNIRSDQGCSRDNGILEFCRMEKITLQAWSPLQDCMAQAAFLANHKKEKALDPLRAKLEDLAESYRTTPEAIAIAWILRHPAQMQAVIGSMNPERIKGICEGSEIVLSREDWYEIYMKAGNHLP